MGSRGDGGAGVPDCFSCKAIGAGGCFGGALYVLYERSKMSLTNKNRHWLLALSLGNDDD